MHPVEVHMPAAMATTNLQLTEAFEEVDQINGASTLQTGFMSEGSRATARPSQCRD